MVRVLNIFFFGLALLFFAVLGLAIYKSMYYVNNNQPFVLSQKKLAKAEKNSTASTADSTSAEFEDALPEIDFAAIDSLLDDEEELDSLIHLAEASIKETAADTIVKTGVSETKDEKAVVLNVKPEKKESKADTKVATIKTPSRVPASYNKNGKYYIAVGAFKNNANARTVYNQLKKKGFKNVKRIKNNTFTSVRLEGYINEASAKRDLTKVRKDFKEAIVLTKR